MYCAECGAGVLSGGRAWLRRFVSPWAQSKTRLMHDIYIDGRPWTVCSRWWWRPGGEAMFQQPFWAGQLQLLWLFIRLIAPAQPGRRAFRPAMAATTSPGGTQPHTRWACASKMRVPGTASSPFSCNSPRHDKIGNDAWTAGELDLRATAIWPAPSAFVLALLQASCQPPAHSLAPPACLKESAAAVSSRHIYAQTPPQGVTSLHIHRLLDAAMSSLHPPSRHAMSCLVGAAGALGRPPRQRQPHADFDTALTV